MLFREKAGLKTMINFAQSRIKSFKFAAHGIFIMLKYEHNAWVHLFATLIVCLAGYFVKISGAEWCLIILSIVSVWTAEALNTALELLADVASPNFHPLVEKSKDVAAGAVLITSIGSVIIAVLIFGPRLADLMR
jgi:diacylglycerol kinase